MSIDTLKRKPQNLTVKRGHSAFIATPLGRIKINFDPPCGDHRKIQFELPPLMKAYKGDKHIPEVPTLVKEEDGVVQANFNLISPLKDNDGELVGFEEAKPFHLSVVDETGDAK